MIVYQNYAGKSWNIDKNPELDQEIHNKSYVVKYIINYV